jgi:hypothetical protein
MMPTAGSAHVSIQPGAMASAVSSQHSSRTESDGLGRTGDVDLVLYELDELLDANASDNDHAAGQRQQG